MKICLILEGSYPYVRGGVSSWTHDLIRAMPDHGFVLWVIGAEETSREKYCYELPGNVVGIHEVFLDEALRAQADRRGRQQITGREIIELKKLFAAEDPDWDILIDCFQRKRTNAISFLMSESFLSLLKDLYRERYAHAPFSSMFYTVRSIFLPLLFLLGSGIPEADIYHATAGGYGGVLGAMGKWKRGSPFLLTEHGIYTREREEELLRSKWVAPDFRDLWISFFRLLSRCAYDRAAAVTSLFSNAMSIQNELGCDRAKCRIIRNGIQTQAFEQIPLKEPDGFVDIGAIARVVPIKDIKTLIYAFSDLQQQVPQARLHILGDLSDEVYSGECMALARQLDIRNIRFEGETDVRKYMAKLDFTVLSSISEGQPLALLESLAARRPAVVTNVGSCREIIEGGSGDGLGAAGLCVPPMHGRALTKAMARLCRDREERLAMGETGNRRVLRYYTHGDMVREYNNLYGEALGLGRNRI